MSDYTCSLMGDWWVIQKLLILYMLFHHNLMIFFSFRECIILFISASVIGIIFILGQFPGNKSFRLEIALCFSNCWMFNFLVTVIKKLLKPLATFLGSFNFSSLTSKVGTCSTECIFPVSFFIMFHIVSVF